MVARSITREIIEQLERLEEPELRRVLDYTRSLREGLPKGESGESIVRIVGAIPKENLKEMSDAIEKDCERVDTDG